ncbi:hypothetical protein V500_01476 [Pseudogymnoascus sp. VKM F-4518 (FW-2643)]|nr:hypothetical protein V500_01476 [Pseudogymnoascus sp. VKM F-4518 (FW-2643)]
MSERDPVAGVQASPQYPGGADEPKIQDIKCDICDKVFTRSEHLRRHKRAHSAEKPFACVECKKRFARQRHQASHELKRKVSESDETRRYSRACFACASARVRCLRGVVCPRCRSRDLRCEYPSRRTRKCESGESTTEADSLDSSRASSEEAGQGDEVMTERDEDESVAVTWENESSSGVFGSIPKESTWTNNLLIPTTSNSTSVGQSWNASGSEVTSVDPTAIQTLLAGEPPMSTRDWLLSRGIISPDTTIVSGAQLVPQVSEGNIGSLYNYSRINWLPPNDISHIDQTFGAASLQSAGSSHASAQDAFTNGPRAQNIQSSPRSATTGHFDESYLESYANSRNIGLASGRSKPFSLERIPSIATVGSPSDASMYYVDGDSAHSPVLSHHKHPNQAPVPVFGGQGSSPLSPTLENIHTQLTEYTHPQIWVAEESYVALIDYLKYTSRRDISLSYTDSFPSLKELNEFVGLYFDRFHESFPLLHKASFLNNRDGCVLELSIAAIGACYVGTSYARKCSESLHELVNKLLEIATSSYYNPSEFPGVFGLRTYPQRPTRLQARILNVLGMFHSGNPKLSSLAREGRAILVTTCIENKLLSSNHYDGWQACLGTDEEGDRFLQQWLEGEMKCRAGYFVWMLDCMMAYESDFRTHMDLLDGKAPLPCPEQIWDEPMLNKAPLLILNGGPPSLCLALDVLYTEKRLVSNLGELSRILLIHGMYRRVWEVARYQSDILSDWVPTALSESHHGVASEKTTMPLTSSVVSRWTNGSCDCLDVLHWSAKSRILQASGLEHPTILHLHLARLILLAPVSDLQELARVKLRQETQSHTESYLDANMQEQDLQNSIHKWVAHDQYKARLAIIHAGSVFWYLRRYSCGAVIEPFANYLATLVLWAYSIATSSAKLLASSTPDTVTYDSQRSANIGIPQTNDASHHTQDLALRPTSERHQSISNYYPNPPSLHAQIAGALDHLECHETSLIQLDRPCDDEIVQLFVRFGEKMTPYMARIGDISTKGSGRKILREGIKLLSSHDNHGLGGVGERMPSCAWGAAERFGELLAALGGAA